MDLELAKLLLEYGAPLGVVVALVVTQSRQRSPEKPAETLTGPTFFQLDAILHDLRRVSEKLDDYHRDEMNAIDEVKDKIRSLKQIA
jgi:hypothetical protein